MARVGGGSLKAGELEVSAGWGVIGAKGIVMQGQGRIVERAAYDPTEYATITDASKKSGASATDLVALLGAPLDIFLGRGLTSAEVKEVSGMIRRIAALVLMQPSLDANYKTVVAKT